MGMLQEKIRVQGKEYRQLVLSTDNGLTCPLRGKEQPIGKCYGCGRFRQVHFGSDTRHVLCAEVVSRD